MTKIVDISSLNLNAVADSEIPYKMIVKRADGSITPLVLHVLGQNADVVERWNAKIFTQWKRDEAIAKRKGKDAELKSFDEYKSDNIDGALVRVVGWEGVSNDFTKDKMREIITNNPHLRDEIVEVSLDAANFTKTA